MRHQMKIELSGERAVKVRYACESVSPDTYYDYMHNHPFWEICLPISGAMLHIAGEHSYHLTSGDVFFVRPGELHYALAAESSVYERFAFWLPTDTFSFLPSGADKIFGVFSDKRLNDGNILHLSSKCEPRLQVLLEAVKSEITKSDPDQLTMFCRVSELLNFISSAAELPENDFEQDSRYDRSPRIIHNIIKYVRDNYATVSGIDEIADHFYMNKDYLTRVFKSYTGFTIHDYIRSVRISKARRMLIDGGGVTETAFACGFNSTSYFIRVFTDATGMTPASFRRSNYDNIISEK